MIAECVGTGRGNIILDVLIQNGDALEKLFPAAFCDVLVYALVRVWPLLVNSNETTPIFALHCGKSSGIR